jgi:hypothetical protein
MGRRLTWEPETSPRFIAVAGKCYLGPPESQAAQRKRIGNTPIDELRKNNQEELKKRTEFQSLKLAEIEKTGIAALLDPEMMSTELAQRKDVKTLLGEFYREETRFVSPGTNREDWQPQDRTDSTHLNFIDLPLHDDLGICSAATKFGLLGGSPPGYSVIRPGGKKPEFADFDEHYRRAALSEPGWVIEPTPAAHYGSENIVDGESYAIWRWTRDTVASIVRAWRAWEAIKKTPSNTHEILEKLYALHDSTLYFLPPELNSEHYDEPDVIPLYLQQPNHMGQLPELPKRKELEKTEYQLPKNFLSQEQQEKLVAFLHLYFKSSIARLCENTFVERHDQAITYTARDFHIMNVDIVNKTLNDWRPETETTTLLGHIFSCLTRHMFPSAGAKAPRFSCCAQCHQWTRISEKSRIKKWGGKLYCSQSCRAASALMATRLKDPETNYVNFKLLHDATELAARRMDRDVNLPEQDIHASDPHADKELFDKEVIQGRLITCIFENLRRNMSIDRLLRGHFRIKDSNEDYEELKKHLELVRRAGQDYPYFDWDD